MTSEAAYDGRGSDVRSVMYVRCTLASDCVVDPINSSTRVPDLKCIVYTFPGSLTFSALTTIGHVGSVTNKITVTCCGIGDVRACPKFLRKKYGRMSNVN